MDAELKPCQHCGSRAKLWTVGKRAMVYCENEDCDDSTSWETKAEAIAMWNRRTNDDGR